MKETDARDSRYDSVIHRSGGRRCFGVLHWSQHGQTRERGTGNRTGQTYTKRLDRTFGLRVIGNEDDAGKKVGFNRKSET